MLEILIGVFQHQQQVMSDCIIHAKVQHLDQVFDLISNGDSGHSQPLVLNLNLVASRDLALENEGKDQLSEMVVELDQFTLFERMVQR